MRIHFPQRVLPGQVPESIDNPARLLPTLSPVIEYPGPVKVAAQIPNTSSNIGDSFLISREIVMVASTAAYGFNFFPITAGLWRLKTFMHAISDFTAVPNVASPLTATLQNVDAASTLVLASGGLVANQNIFSQTDYTLNIQRDGWLIACTGPATAAGQTYHVFYTFQGSRLA